MNCNVAIMSMHDYLDGELSKDDVAKLKAHLNACPVCRSRYEQLERTEALAHSAIQPIRFANRGSSTLLTQRIMNQLPAARRRRMSGSLQWIRRHPMISVAAVFVLLMLSSFLTMWEQDNQLSITGTDLAQVIIDGNTVTVPLGAHIRGDLTIHNGKANLLGDVEGNVTVVDGQLYQASTAHISGQVKKIDQVLDWFWYKVTTSISKLAY